MRNLELSLIGDDKVLRAVLVWAAPPRGDPGHMESQRMLVFQEGVEACRN